jgi:hypothetical protein
MRYIRRDPVVRDTPDTSSDWLKSLSLQELDELTGLGWDVGLVQIGSRSARCVPKVGRALGEAAGHNARKLGAPRGVHVYCDTEFSFSPASHAMASFLESWCAGLATGGDGRYLAGDYVTPDQASLRSEGLYRLPFRSYWYSATYHCGVAVRGPQIVQTGPFAMGGGMCWPVDVKYQPAEGELLCDLDRFGYDHRGQRTKLIAA